MHKHAEPGEAAPAESFPTDLARGDSGRVEHEELASGVMLAAEAAR